MKALAPSTRYLVAAPRALAEGSLEEMLRELREAGFVDHGSDGYTVTPSGADLLKRLSDVQAFATRWVAGRAKKA